MYDIVIRFLARVFVTNAETAPTAERFASLAAMVGKPDFLPLPFQEIGPSGMQTRVGLRSADSTRTILFRGESVDFEYHQPIDEAKGVLSLEDFCSEAGEALALALEGKKLLAHRIAAVQEGLLQPMTNETIDAWSRKLLTVPPGLPLTAPFEWDWRAAFKVDRALGADDEKTNTLITVKRMTGKLPDGQPLDRVQVNTDVNTAPENNRPRFDAAQVRAFFATAPAWHHELVETVLAYCGASDES